MLLGIALAAQRVDRWSPLIATRQSLNKRLFSSALAAQRVPALGLELEFLVVAGDEDVAEAGIGDVANELDILYLLYLLVVADGHGEEQLVVFTAIEGTGGDIHVQLLSHDGGLVVDGQLLLEDAAADVALLADVHEFAAEAIADVHHCCGVDASVTQSLDDVTTGFGLQLALEEVFLAGEVGLEIGDISGGRTAGHPAGAG